jgi:hypothetical protein
MILPDPVAFFKQKKTYNQIERLIECHPIIYSKNKVEGGTSLNRGSIVEIEFVDGIPRFTPTGGSNSDYFRISIPPEVSRNTKPSGIAQAAFIGQGQVNTLGESVTPSTWTLDTKSPITTKLQKDFLDLLAPRLPFDIIVTSGTRSPESQVDAMFVKAEIGGLQELLNTYKDDDFARAIWNAYPDRSAAIKVVEEYATRGGGSSHLRGAAVDIRVRTLSDEQVTLLINEVKALGQKPLLEATPPHLHVTLIGKGKQE